MATEYRDNPPQYFKPNIPNNSPNVAGYSVTVTDDGATNIFRKNKNNTLQAVGKIAKGGGFSAVPLGQFSNQATQAEIDYFTANARKTVIEQAVPVVRRGIGGDAGGGNSKINQILGTNLSSSPPNQPSPDGGSSTPVTPPNETPPANAKQFLMYPLQMRGDQDRIMFHAHEYKSGGRLGGGDFELSAVKYIPLKERIFLSIQASITDQNSVGWEPDTMNPIEIQAALISSPLMKSGAERNVTGEAADKFMSALMAARQESEAVRTWLVGQAIGVNNLQSRLLGQVLNPNLELLFQGPQLRPFNFTFKMSARGLDEAKEIKKIIRYFKKNMAVKKGDNNIFLKAPNVFKIQYQYGNGTPHKSLNLIKMCALTNCSVDYTPLGSYMTYDDEDKTMVAYTMSLQFQELTPIYDTDYEDKDNKIEGKFEYGEGQTIKVPSENSIGP